VSATLITSVGDGLGCRGQDVVERRTAVSGRTDKDVGTVFFAMHRLGDAGLLGSEF
jgi:hypothetical protein